MASPLRLPMAGYISELHDFQSAGRLGIYRSGTEAEWVEGTGARATCSGLGNYILDKGCQYAPE